MKKLFDTTFLVHYLTRPSKVESYLEAHEPPETTLLASAISMKELAVGLHHVTDDPSIADLESDFAWLDVRPFSTRHAFFAGRIETALRANGLSRERLNALGGDILIGGAALAEDATVVTENTTDFDLMPGVHVEAY